MQPLQPRQSLQPRHQCRSPLSAAAAVAVAGLILGTAVGPAAPAAATESAAPSAPPPASAPPRAAGPTGAPGGTPGDPVVASRAVPPTDPRTDAPEGRVATRAGTVAALAPVRTAPFAMLGVTWDPGPTPADVRVEVRLHTTDRGRTGWGRWQQLEYVAGEGPSVAEEAAVRAGTIPLWVRSADGVAVRLRARDGEAPRGVEVVTIQPGPTVEARAGRGRHVAKRRPSSGARITGAPNRPQLPRVITRRQWGADRSLLNCRTSYDSTAKMVFVHHTVGANRYTPRESPGIVRSILAYHTQGQGWCDIGYNALIDRFGNIYVGRRGGVGKPVRGAHAGDWNTNTVGVSLMGDFERAKPSRRMLNALVRFVGWRLGTSFAPVRGRTRINGEGFARISGHRDAMSTLCPGGRVYNRLDWVRKRVRHYLSDYRSAAERKAGQLSRRRTGAVFVGERWTHGGSTTRFADGRIYSKRGLGAHWLGGRLLRRYQGEGGVTGVLGWPRSDAHRTSQGRTRLIGFTRGRMYLTRGNPIREVHGRILDRYRRLGSASGRLGVPTSSIQRLRRGHRATFRHGVIRWHRPNDSFRVRFR